MMKNEYKTIKKFFDRKIFKELKKNIKNRKVIILTGSRQVGKTSLMKMLQKELPKNSLSAFIDMDIISNREYGQSLENFLDFLILNGYEEKSKKTFFVFVDEFQVVNGLGNIFKNIYDNYSNIKIFASGSSSLSIKKGIKESLAGRKFIFEIYPLDFEEFLIFKEDQKILQEYKNFPKLKSEEIKWSVQMEKYLEEFLIFGGYPEIVLSLNNSEKKKILKSIFDLYLEKDILQFSGIENIFEFKKLVEILAVQNGGQLNFNSLAQETSLHNKTVRNYISLLEETYLIKVVRPFFKNKKKEIIRAPKIYFLDNGVRNFFIKNYSDLEKRTEKGEIFEAYILQESIKNNSEVEIKYWRTKSGQEVDFILKFDDGEIIPIEIKYNGRKKKIFSNNLFSFLEKYSLKKGILLSKNINSEIQEKNKKVIFKRAVNFTRYFF